MSEAFERKIYTTRLQPHRSLTPRAFTVFILCFCLAQVILALPFLMMGAWPVAGFMGLDALALYVAFRISFRSAPAYETLDPMPIELVHAKIGVRGHRREWRFNPSWVRLEEEIHEEFGVQRLALASRGERIEIGAFLGPEQKAGLARDLRQALSAARRGPQFD